MPYQRYLQLQEINEFLYSNNIFQLVFNLLWILMPKTNDRNTCKKCNERKFWQVIVFCRSNMSIFKLLFLSKFHTFVITLGFTTELFMYHSYKQRYLILENYDETPCKIGTGISLGSRQDSRRSPGSHPDHSAGKIPAAHLGKNPTEKSVLAGILPRKKLFSRIRARILPGSKPLIAFAARLNPR